jgi:ATP-dependent DNA helicase PIF1
MPASLPLDKVENTSDFFASLINTFQRHRNCREGSCLRYNKRTKDMRCRYHFPRQLLEAAGVTMGIDGKSWKFAPKRNDQRMNQCVAEMVIGWMANTDFQPATSINGLIEYAAKYCSKPGKESKSYSDLTKEVI